MELVDESLIESAPDVELIEIEDVSLTTACDAAAQQASLQALQLQTRQNTLDAVGDCIEGAWLIAIPTENAGTLIEQALREISD